MANNNEQQILVAEIRGKLAELNALLGLVVNDTARVAALQNVLTSGHTTLRLLIEEAESLPAAARRVDHHHKFRDLAAYISAITAETKSLLVPSPRAPAADSYQQLSDLHTQCRAAENARKEARELDEIAARLTMAEGKFTVSDSACLFTPPHAHIVSATLKSTGLPVSLHYLHLGWILETDQAARAAFLREANKWTQLHHLHILDFLGLNFAGPRPYLVTAAVTGENLADYAALQPEAHLSLLLEIARGMAAMHDAGLLHGDLRAATVFVDDAGHAKIAHHGLARLVNFAMRDKNFYPGGRGAACVRWLAPERYEEGSKATTEPDVFAFGMLCYEVVAGQVPFAEVKDSMAIAGMIRDGKRPAAPVHAPTYSREMWGLIERCWAADFKTRPSFTTIVAQIEEIMAAERWTHVVE
ncbi:hypothetical protein H9P43_009363 [Blastocladiella emersonii ATCC 22665]|nr:hypothetical protein H9P43_009363 [Blastocladiella emersonii ATCC 22665]